jgi:hypothetical protein
MTAGESFRRSRFPWPSIKRPEGNDVSRCSGRWPQERIGKLNLVWIEFEQGSSDPAAFLREAHTLKGEASLTGFALASKLVHAVEDYVKLVRDRGEGASRARRRFDLERAGFGAAAHPGRTRCTFA